MKMISGPIPKAMASLLHDLMTCLASCCRLLGPACATSELSFVTFVFLCALNAGWPIAQTLQAGFLENEKYPPSRQKSTKNKTKRPGSHLEPGRVEGGAGGAPEAGARAGSFSSFLRACLLDSPGFSLSCVSGPRFSPACSPRFSGGPSSILLVSPRFSSGPSPPPKSNQTGLGPSRAPEPATEPILGKIEAKEKKH